MKKDTNIRQALLSLLLLAATPALAQMDNVVEVEDSYKPVVKDANKLNLMPEIETPTLKHYSISYAEHLYPTSQYVFHPTWVAASDATAMGAPRGFFTLGGSNIGNLNLRGAYGLKLTPDDQLSFDLSSSGYSTKLQARGWEDGYKTNKRYYATRGAVGYEHKLNHLSSVLVNASVESQVFNYNEEDWVPTPPEFTDKQHNWLTDMSVALTPYRQDEWSIGASAGLHLFNQKYAVYPRDQKNKETKIDGKVLLGYHFDEEQAIGLDLSAQHLGYNLHGFKSNNSFGLNPHYDLKTDRLILRAGALLNINGGVEDKARIAPDIMMRFHAEPELDIFAEIGGGEVTSDFRMFNSLTPYWELPWSEVYYLWQGEDGDSQNNYYLCHQPRNQFDQLRSKAGVEWKIAKGLQAIVHAGYDISKNRCEIDWTQRLHQVDGTRLHGGIDVTYLYTDRLRLLFSGELNKWTTDEENLQTDQLLAWRPVVEMNTEATCLITEGLNLTVDWKFQTYSRKSTLFYRRPTTSVLGATLSYQLPVDWLGQKSKTTAYLRGNNLFDKDYDICHYYCAPGPNVLAGIAVTF